MDELLSLWLLLHLSSSIGVDEIRVFGDSKVIIDWENNACEINILHLSAWLKRTRSLISKFCVISFEHIYRSYNQFADQLSKIGHAAHVGFFFYERWVDGARVLEVSQRTFLC